MVLPASTSITLDYLQWKSRFSKIWLVQICHKKSTFSTECTFFITSPYSKDGDKTKVQVFEQHTLPTAPLKMRERTQNGSLSKSWALSQASQACFAALSQQMESLAIFYTKHLAKAKFSDNTLKSVLASYESILRA